MKTYWDSSAIIAALHHPAVRRQLGAAARNFTRPHALAECFSTLTGGRMGRKYRPDDAAAMLEDWAESLSWVELDHEETLEALGLAQARGITGGRVHDWLHAVAAKKAGVTRIKTCNLSDFRGLNIGLTIEAP